MRAILALLIVVLPVSAGASPRPESADTRLSYEAYAHGFPVLRMAVTLRMTAARYRVVLAYHTIGLGGFFYPGHQLDAVHGRWRGGLLTVSDPPEDEPSPGQYVATGSWGGVVNRTVIDYLGREPRVRQLVPRERSTREPVPLALRRDTIDTLSAAAMLLRHVADTGQCDAAARTFDGRRLSTIAAHTAGRQTLAPTARSDFAGPALRCDFVGRMTAGFKVGRELADRRPMRGAAWLAALRPGGMAVPVRLRFDTDWLGEVTMYLRRAVPVLASLRTSPPVDAVPGNPAAGAGHGASASTLTRRPERTVTRAPAASPG